MLSGKNTMHTPPFQSQEFSQVTMQRFPGGEQSYRRRLHGFASGCTVTHELAFVAGGMRRARRLAGATNPWFRFLVANTNG